MNNLNYEYEIFSFLPLKHFSPREGRAREEKLSLHHVRMGSGEMIGVGIIDDSFDVLKDGRSMALLIVRSLGPILSLMSLVSLASMHE